ncbi:MAG: acetyl esterase, partial [Pseudonocardiales bacterium]|nr:acetyl esterase [Pseudonocardiales bacterium]
FVTGSVGVADRACRSLAAASRWVVASVEYRLAPETAFPGPLHDCVSTVRWLTAHSEAIGGDASTTVIAGDSAGGALATACSTVLRDLGDAVPSGQILIYPTLGPIGSRTSESIRAYGDLPSLTRGSIDWFWSHYVPGSEADPDPHAAPLRQQVLAGLPDTTVVAAGCDLLRDDAIVYTSRLSSAGVGTRLHVVEGAIHGFWWMDGVLGQAAELTELLAEDLRDRAEGRWQPSQ